MTLVPILVLTLVLILASPISGPTCPKFALTYIKTTFLVSHLSLLLQTGHQSTSLSIVFEGETDMEAIRIRLFQNGGTK